MHCVEINLYLVRIWYVYCFYAYINFVDVFMQTLLSRDIYLHVGHDFNL